MLAIDTNCISNNITILLLLITLNFITFWKCLSLVLIISLLIQSQRTCTVYSLFSEYLLGVYYLHSRGTKHCGSKDKEDTEMQKNKMHDQFMKLPTMKCD